MQFWTGQSSGYKFYANSTGDETNELLALDASGNATFAGSVYSPSTIGNLTPGSLGQQMELGNASVATFRFDANRWRLYAGASAGEVFTVEETGNVGINNTGPDYKLEVNGTFGVSDLPFNASSTSVLVANEALSAELVTNGDFDTDTNWVNQTGTNWSISGGKASVSNTGNVRYFQQSGVLPNPSANKSFLIKWTISGLTQGGIGVNVGGYTTTTIQTSNGTYEQEVTPTNGSSNTLVYLQSNANTIGSVDNVSVKEITSASNQIQKRELGTGAFGPTPVGAYLPLAAGSGSPLTGTLYGTSTNFTGGATYAGSMNLGNGGGTGEKHLTIGNGSTGSGYRYIDLVGDTTYTDYGLRIIRGNSGANTSSQIIHRGTGDFSLQTTEAANLRFVIANSEKMRINSSGNVGIGTTSPAAKLHVNAGNVEIENTHANLFLNSTITTGVSNSIFSLLTGSSSPPQGFLEWKSGQYGGGSKWLTRLTSIPYTSSYINLPHSAAGGNFAINLENTERFTINRSNGNVGIGTTSPDYKLDIEGSSPFLRINNTTETNAGIIFQDTADTGQSAAIKYNSSDNSLSFSNFSSNVERMRIDKDGNVGIGTASPSAKLDVQGTQGQLFSVTDDLSGDIFSVADISGVPILNVNSSGLVTVDGTSYFNGNVGIGTNSPGAKLEVEGDATGDDTPQLIVASGGADNNAIIHFTDDAGSQVNAIGALEGNTLTFASQNELVFKTNTSSILGTTDTKMTIDTDGKVGIGTTSPTEKLDVAGIIQSNAYGFQIDTQGYGDIRLRAYYSALNTNATLYVGGVNGYAYKGVYALSFNVNSDYRLKTNVVDLEEAIERVKQINVHRFNWKDRLDEEKVDGFLAHELAEVIPEAVAGEKDAVREDGTLDYQGVDQSKVVPLLTAALQEAISKIEQLETRIQTLENN
jgi:hypothetical protein